MGPSSYPEPNTSSLHSTLYHWIDERLGLTEIIAFASHKTVPEHRYSFWYYWGGLSLFFFFVQVFSGVLLLVYYRPGTEAYESVRQITYDIRFGWLIRSAHSWSANLMVFAIFVHMFSVFFMKAYRKPNSKTDIRVAIQLRDNVRSLLVRRPNKVVLQVENRYGVFSQIKVEDNQSYKEKVSEAKTEAGKLYIPKSDSVEDILENIT
ncbi:MAG TPA: hypothetical protein PLB32_11620, partial [Acidobacteriota bacterium]|nr:hypothetical protein [Acidobacteriota bacterium]